MGRMDREEGTKLGASALSLDPEVVGISLMSLFVFGPLLYMVFPRNFRAIRGVFGVRCGVSVWWVRSEYFGG